jgi:hypothetical protein
VIVLIIATVLLIIDDYVVQDNTSMYDQLESVLRVRPNMDGYPHLSSSMFTSLRIMDASLVEE